MGDMIRGRIFNGNWESQADEILQSIAFAVWSTVIAAIGYSPSQTIFNRDMILNINEEVNWTLINKTKLANKQKSNEYENQSRMITNTHQDKKSC